MVLPFKGAEDYTKLHQVH